MKVSIVAPWYGSTAHLVADFARAVRGADEVVAVDDVCSEDTKIALRHAAGDAPEASHDVDVPLEIVENPRNIGFAASCNAGYARATGDVVCFLNSDVVGQPRRLAKALAREVPEGVLVGPALGQQWAFATPFAYVDGWCVAARKKTWEALILPGNVGPWDAVGYPEPYWEDVDLSLRASLAGFHIENRQWGSFLSHKAGQSMGFAPKWGESYEKNRRTFLERARPAWQQLLENAGKRARP